MQGHWSQTRSIWQAKNIDSFIHLKNAFLSTCNTSQRGKKKAKISALYKAHVLADVLRTYCF